MQYRELGKTGFKVSEVSLGTWQVGGTWGSGFNEQRADTIINQAIDKGVNFIDTADVYEMGKSESAVGKAVKNSSERIYIATKCGRAIDPHTNEHYTTDRLKQCVEMSLKRLQVDCIDLIQLHCPPKEVYDRAEVFDLFNQLKKEGKIRHLGVSVETVSEALKAITYDNVSTIQIIFNIFRQKPAKSFFQAAHKNNIGIIARVPLASGLLTGKFSSQTTFNKKDHRYFNREGEYFDKGETFSGIDYETGIEAVEKIKALFPHLENLSPVALHWILQFSQVSCIIPGASSAEQVNSNLSIYDHPPLTKQDIEKINQIYTSTIQDQIDHLW